METCSTGITVFGGGAERMLKRPGAVALTTPAASAPAHLNRLRRVVVRIGPPIMFTRRVVRAAQNMNFAASWPTRGGAWIEVIRPNVEPESSPFGLLN